MIFFQNDAQFQRYPFWLTGLTLNGFSAILLFFNEVSVFREYRTVSDRVWTEQKLHHSPPDLQPVASSSAGVKPVEMTRVVLTLPDSF